MKTLVCDMMSEEILGKVDLMCITTNGFVKKNGECVMGRGIAKAFADRYKDLPKILGYRIHKYDNNVKYLLHVDKTMIASFPVKPTTITFDGNNVVNHMANRFKIGDVVPGWAAKADIEIIKRSLYQLKNVVESLELKEAYIPLPGCGAGELSWINNVLPIVQEVIGQDDRFVFCSFNQRDFYK